MTSYSSTCSPSSLEAKIMTKLAAMRGAGEQADPFYLIDLETVSHRFNYWHETFQNMIHPFYAVKCNPNPVLLHLLDRLGANFDCASKEEIDRVLDMGVDPSRIIFANPCKMPAQILHAKLRHVKRMTFDNEDELIKVSQLYPEAELVVRIITDDSHSMCRFSSKFGARLVDAKKLLVLAKELKIAVVGVSFHVGSGCEDPAAFEAAALDALKVFKMAEELGMPKMKLLDVGGGFQGVPDAKPALTDVAKFLLPALRKFPEGTQIIAEPGRYMSAECHTLVANIHSRRVIRDDVTGKITQILYYINEGVYHSFNCIFFDHQHPEPKWLGMADPKAEKKELIASTVFGPTCDSLDFIVKDFPMPLHEVGDWLYFTNMGSYTTAALTRFNGFTGALTCHYTWGTKFLENVLTDISSIEFPGLPPARKQVNKTQAASEATCISPEAPTWVPVPTHSPEPAATH